MKSNLTHAGELYVARVRMHPFFRGFVQGTASLLDIFGVRHRRSHATLVDDARELQGDVEEIAQDFHAVLSSIASGTKK